MYYVCKPIYCYKKVLSFVAPYGELELLWAYKVNTISFVALCSLYVP